MDCSSKSVWLPNIYLADLFLKKDRSGFVMICDTTCGYCRKEVKSAHGIEALYMYFNGSGIWGCETSYISFLGAVVELRKKNVDL